ncbi:elongation factor G [bacterium]|nr:elongation factor G [Chloroflexi bacterium CFX6]RIL12058.1 MAG: elongation factor G [bacterium]
MKEYTTDKVRNVALVGHSGSGKTSIAEAALFVSKATNRQGRTEEGNTVSDFDAEEVRRGISISTSLVPVEWNGHKLNLLDTPGYADFIGEVIATLHAVECAVVVVDAVAGVEVGTEIAWQHLDDLGLPRIVVINKMNRDNADPAKVLAQLQATFEGVRFAPLEVPVGRAASFEGVYRVVGETASLGKDGHAGAVPADVAADGKRGHDALVEAAAESDDALMVKYFDEGDLSADETRAGLVKGAKGNAYVPVLYTAATEDLGMHAFLDMLVTYVASPLEAPARKATSPKAGAVELKPDPAGHLAALVFKTQADPYVGKLQYLRVLSGTFKADSRVFNANRGEEERIGPVYVLRGKEQMTVGHLYAGDIGAVAKLQHTHTADTLCDKDHPLELPGFTYPVPLYSVALKPVSQADGTKLGGSLQRIVDEDPTLSSHVEDSTHELLLSGMGDTHVDVAVRRLKEKFGVNVTTAVPHIPYRETISRTASTQYRHKKQSGGAGQFAEVHLRVEPRESGAGFEFASEVFGGAISGPFIASTEKGIRHSLAEGVVAGYPVVDVKAVVFDGKEHPVDSKDIAFQIAGRGAFKEAFLQAGPVLLEPVYNVRIVVPGGQMGDILGDLNTRRGMVQGTEQVGTKAVVSAQVPLAELLRYSTDLRSMTQGRGYYTMEFAHFAQVPHQIAQGVIAQAQKDRHEEE